MRFESPIGSKNFANKPIKEFEVPDESNRPLSKEEMIEENVRKLREFQERVQSTQEDDMEVERQIREAREAKRTGRERLTEGAKRRIETLIGMTRTIHSVDINGNVFVFQSLKAKEVRDAILAISKFDGNVQSLFETRKQFLARSLIQIAGVDIEQFLGSVTLESKLDFIEELDDVLLNRLYDEYLKLTNEAKSKYAVNTDNDAKEIVEDLKK